MLILCVALLILRRPPWVFSVLDIVYLVAVMALVAVQRFDYASSPIESEGRVIDARSPTLRRAMKTVGLTAVLWAAVNSFQI